MYTYDGRQVCAFKPQGLSTEGVSRQLVSLSSDTLATAVGCSVRCYETAQGRPVGEVLNHSLEVKAVCLSQVRVRIWVWWWGHNLRAFLVAGGVLSHTR